VSGTCIAADNLSVVTRNQFSTVWSQLVNLASVSSGICVIYAGPIFGPFVPGGLAGLLQRGKNLSFVF